MVRKLIYLSMIIVLLAASPISALAQPIVSAEISPQQTVAILAPMATLTVDTAVDENDGSCSDGDCSLRDAIAAAAAGDTITFDNGYLITLDSPLVVSTNLTIDGSGHAITVSGNDTVRVLTVYTDTHVTIDHLTIAHGSATAPEYGSHPVGGGMKIEPGAVVTLTHSAVLSNTATYADSGDYYGHGGGIYNLGTLTLISSTVSDNVASSRIGYPNGDGGAIYNRGTLTVTDSTFARNAAEMGGAIYNRSGATLKVESSTITENSAPCGSSGISNRGTATVSDSTISNNFVSDDWCEGDAAGIGNTGTMTITRSTISGNINEYRSGGGLSSVDGQLTVIDSTIYNNTANVDGAGIYNWWDSTLTVINSTIYSNTAGWFGGGILNGGNINTKLTLINSTLSHNTAQYGGGLCNGHPSGFAREVLTMTNSTVVSNTALIGGGIYNGDATPTLSNSILWDNDAPTGAEIHNTTTLSPTIRYSDIEGSGGSGSAWNTSLGSDGGGNIDADPLFVDAAGADLRLTDGSPAIDAADNRAVPADAYDLDGDGNTSEALPYDLDGTPRFQDYVTPDTGNGTAPIVDMGAYEHSTTPPTISDIADQTTAEDTPTSAIPFTVGDAETDPSSLTVSAASGNPALAPLSGIVFDGTGADRTVTITPTADLNGTAAITITVSDGSASTSDSFTLTVTPVNDAPVVEIVSAGDAIEGLPVLFQGAYSGAALRGVQADAITWRFGDGGTASGVLTPTHIYTDNDTYIVTLTVTDTLGGVGQDTLLVTVTNSAPVLGMLDDQTVLEDAELVISVTYSDSGSADTHTAQIDWGDGNVTEGVVDAVNGKVNGSHTYAAPGTYSLILTLHDDDDGTDSLTVEVVVSPASYLTSLPIVILGR